MAQPSVSIVIPFYKGEQYLINTVQSILEQTYSDFEVLIVNDGSPNTSDAFFESVTALDSKIKVINKDNGGVACARKFGIEMASSEFIAFCDQDDLWLPTKLEKQMVLFDDQEVGLVFCGAIEDHVSTNISENRKVKLPFYDRFRGHIFEALLNRNEIVSCTAVARKSLLVDVEAFDSDRDLMGVDDWLAWLKLSLVCKVDFVEEYLAIHVFHENNYSSNELKMYKAEQVCLEKIKPIAIGINNASNIDYQTVELNMHLRYAESLIYTQDFTNGTIALAKANKIKFGLARTLKIILFTLIPNRLLNYLQKSKRKAVKVKG